MIYLIVSVIATSILYYMGHTAPMGYEDETGFHYTHEDSK